jgi:nitrite reductase (NO-forming)
VHLRVISLLSLGLVMALVAGCSVGSAGKVQTLQVTAANMVFDTPEITLKKGQPIKVVLVNQDGVVHDISVDHVPGKVKKQTSDAHAHEAGSKAPDLHVSASPNGTGSVEFTPTTEGAYEFYCAVAGHKEAGMVGRLTVQ